MAIPKQVVTGAAEADDALRSFLSAATPQPADTPPPAPPAPPTPAPVAQDTPPAPPQPSVVPTNVEAELARLQGQFSTLQGMFANNQRELAAARDELRARPATPAEPPKPQRLLSDEEVKEYGEGFLDVVRRTVREDLMPIIQPLLSRVEQLERGVSAAKDSLRNVTETVQLSAEDKFWGTVNQLVPKYDAINVDPRFMQWLQQKAPYSKNTKHELLISAAQNLDAETVATFYNDFEANLTGGTPSPTPAPVPSPTPAPSAADPAAGLIAPSASAPAQPVPGEQGQLWTQADVDELYRRQRKGTISMVDFERLEQDLIRATYEGRVRG